MTTIWQEARTLIASDKAVAALELLYNNTSNNAQDEVRIYQARLASIIRKEKVFLANISNEKLKLYDAILSFITQQEKGKNNTINFNIYQKRIDSIKNNITDTYVLLEQWETQFKLAENNPSDQKRAKNEILRLQSIIDTYIVELTELEKLQK